MKFDFEKARDAVIGVGPEYFHEPMLFLKFQDPILIKQSALTKIRQGFTVSELYQAVISSSENWYLSKLCVVHHLSSLTLRYRYRDWDGSYVFEAFSEFEVSPEYFEAPPIQPSSPRLSKNYLGTCDKEKFRETSLAFKKWQKSLNDRARAIGSSDRFHVRARGRAGKNNPLKNLCSKEKWRSLTRREVNPLVAERFDFYVEIVRNKRKNNQFLSDLEVTFD